MRILTWNVNGLSSCIRDGGIEAIMKLDADIICIQESRIPDSIKGIIPGYHHHFFHSRLKGYAGIVTLSKDIPIRVFDGLSDIFSIFLKNEGSSIISDSFLSDGMDIREAYDEIDDLEEARIVITEFSEFFLANVYFPTFQKKLDRRDYRAIFDFRLFNALRVLDEIKPVILCGDFNTTLSELDIYPENDKMHREDNGFLEDARTSLLEFMAYGFVDAYRLLHPDEEDCYTWWSQRRYRRRENRGWRLDMFIVSESLSGTVRDVKNLKDIEGSDHCPVLLDIDI